MKSQYCLPTFLLILFLPLVLLQPGFAQPVHTAERTMTGSGQIPDPKNNYVNDYSGIMKGTDVDYLKGKLEQVEKQTGIEIVIVAVSRMSPYGGSEIKELARNFFNTWGVGNKKTNDGLLVLVAKDDRKMAIEVGDGWGTRLKDKLSTIIQTEFAPAFKADRYSSGIVDGTEALIKLVTQPLAWYEYWWVRALFWGFVTVILVFMAISCFRDGRDGWGYALLFAAAATLWFFISAVSAGRSKGDSGSFGGGFSSGGGGASGSW